jgi:hypothetical protein
MGPPTIRLQSGLYPQIQSSGTTFRPTISPAISFAPPLDDRPQDAEQLQDALASAGVDLKAEEFNLSNALMTSTTPQATSFVFPPTYGGGLQLQQQVDDGKLIFNRAILSRYVDRIGISLQLF